MKWFALAMAVMIVCGIGFTVWAVDRRGDYEDGCASAGGVAVKSHLGPMVCVKRDALIPEDEWR